MKKAPKWLWQVVIAVMVIAAIWLVYNFALGGTFEAPPPPETDKGLQAEIAAEEALKRYRFRSVGQITNRIS